MGHRSQTFRHFGPCSGSFFRKICRKIRDVLRKEDGVSLVEFALLAPMLVFGVLATVDLGRAISERMTIGHILRAGAQSATEDVGLAKVDLVLRTTAAKNMTVAAAGAMGTDTSLALTVHRMCACAAQPSVEVACSTTCAEDAPTQIYYILSGKKTYAGLLLPGISQSKSLEVQVR
ncbi:MAG: TadE/TadG family type IV pilus assembly protein [Cypionkella sp.]